MPNRDQHPPRLDPAHIWCICGSAAPGRDRHGNALLTGGPDGIHVHLPSRAGARSARTALSLVGYQVLRNTGDSHGRHLLVRGWSAEALDARLIAMRSVAGQLAANPGSTATLALDRLGTLPPAALPGRAGQQQLSRQAAAQLLRWIFTTSGIHAPHDPLAMPADAGCASLLSAAWRLEEAIEDLAVRQVRVAASAVALYPALRQEMGHDSARDTAVRRASVVFHLSSRAAQDPTRILRNARLTPAAGGSRRSAAATRASPSSRRGIESHGQDAQIYPFTGPDAAPDRPPRATACSHGRTFPSGRAGRHP